jgi:uncharacterized protein YeaO (DUF488 family)
MSRRSPRPGVKRVYEPPEASDGTRVLVDRIWPRGLTKKHASVDVWLKDIAPSAGLRIGFGHDPNRRREFHKRYFEERRANHAVVEHLTDLVSTGKVTLLFGAHDTERNNAAGSRTTSRHTSRGRCSGSEARSSRHHSLPSVRRRRYRSYGCRR